MNNALELDPEFQGVEFLRKRPFLPAFMRARSEAVIYAKD